VPLRGVLPLVSIVHDQRVHISAWHESVGNCAKVGTRPSISRHSAIVYGLHGSAGQDGDP
jgi:hypothetical protein